jgi:hypothetical protein
MYVLTRIIYGPTETRSVSLDVAHFVVRQHLANGQRSSPETRNIRKRKRVGGNDILSLTLRLTVAHGAPDRPRFINNPGLAGFSA